MLLNRFPKFGFEV